MKKMRWDEITPYPVKARRILDYANGTEQSVLHVTPEKTEVVQMDMSSFVTEGTFLKKEEVKKSLKTKILTDVRLVKGKFGEKAAFDVDVDGVARTIQLNRTSIEALCKVFGKESHKWVGKSIVISKENVMVGTEKKEMFVIDAA